jgi:hypothetical protein
MKESQRLSNREWQVTDRDHQSPEGLPGAYYGYTVP